MAIHLNRPTLTSRQAVQSQDQATIRSWRGQAKPLTYDNAVSMLTIGNPLDKAIVALAKQAGISHRLAAHSGRVGLASD